MASKSKQSSSVRQLLTVIFIIVATITTIYYANNMLNKQQILKIGANSGTANLFFEPNQLQISGVTPVNLWVTTDKGLGFVHLEISFDHTKLQLTQEISLLIPSLNKTIIKTSMQEANTTGKITLALAATKDTMSTSPSGSNKLAVITLKPITTLQNVNSEISLTNGYNQLVDNTATSFSSTFTNQAIIINQTASTTPTPTPIPLPSPSALPSQISILPIADTYVSAGSPLKNYSAATSIKADSNPETIMYYKFDLTGLPKRIIKRATLDVNVVNKALPSSKQKIYLVPANTWNEQMLTFTSKATYTSQIGIIQNATNRGMLSIDLTSAVQDNLGQIFSFAITNDNSDSLDFASKESKAPPVLTITY